MKNKAILLLSLPLLGGVAFAQDSIIFNAAPNQIARGMLSNRKGLVVTSDGRLWALSFWNDKKTADPSKDYHLLLHSSSDGGKTWKKVSEARTQGETYGSLVTGPRGKRLHIVWSGYDGKKNPSRPGKYLSSIYYGVFDTGKGSWLGTKDSLIQAAGSDREQYYDPDIEVSPDGEIFISFGNRYVAPKGSIGTPGSWNSYLVWNKGQGWSKPHRINATTYGVGCDLHYSPFDDKLHMAYRVNTGGYGTAYRSFDLSKSAFGPEIMVPVPPGAKGRFHGNRNHLAVDPKTGDIWVLYVRNEPSKTPKVSEIRAAYLKRGAGAFSKDFLVSTDTFGLGGNVSSYHYSLAATLTGKVTVLFSLKSESYSKLYQRILLPVAILPKVKLRTGRTKQFSWIAGYRPTMQGGGLHALISDQSSIGPLAGGRTLFLGPVTGSMVLHGAGCDGGKYKSPIAAANGAPTLGGKIPLSFYAFPPKAPAVLLAGVNDQNLGGLALPLPLYPLGLTGCFLHQDVLITLGFAADLNGVAALPLPLPNDPRLAGLPLFFQAYVVAPAANSGNGLMTNGLSSIAR
ncbi:MAG TPA: exo-alpha-sialidase [Planctomycetes bacterium]|nr:exo-alpha-sialidase [Planctomycetota bacterium]